ncbi:MAG: hypothetical protein M3R51_08895 [Candidatus Eremiobacteraeota bacterium]|nr:hypothetical protein [Candidatus Eremiobacteraeota bacterium]
MKTVHRQRNVYCPFTSAVPLIERFHRKAPLKVGPFAFMELGVEHTLAETQDYTDAARAHEALILQWRCHGLLPVPRFRGMITVRPNGLTTEIRIDGQYMPPFGPLGDVFDRVLGSHIAGRTLSRFLDRISAFIDTEYGKDRMPSPSATI